MYAGRDDVDGRQPCFAFLTLLHVIPFVVAFFFSFYSYSELQQPEFLPSTIIAFLSFALFFLACPFYFIPLLFSFSLLHHHASTLLFMHLQRY
jgi:hypothetical protein